MLSILTIREGRKSKANKLPKYCFDFCLFSLGGWGKKGMLSWVSKGLCQLGSKPTEKAVCLQLLSEGVLKADI